MLFLEVLEDFLVPISSPSHQRKQYTQDSLVLTFPLQREPLSDVCNYR